MQYLGYAEKVSWYSFLALLTLAPFFFVPVASLTVPAAKMALAAILTAVAAVTAVLSILSRGSLRLPRHLLLPAAALLPLAYFVSALSTGLSRESILGSGEQDTVVAMIIFVALFFVGVVVLISDERLLAGLKAFLLGLGAMLLLQIVHLAAPSFTFGGAIIGVAGSAAGSWHDLAILAGLSLFLSLALKPTRVAENPRVRYGLYALAAVSAIFLILTNASDVWLGLTLLSILYAIYAWRYVPPQGDPGNPGAVRGVLFWIVLAILFAGLFWGGSVIQSRFPQQLQVTQLEVRPSWQGTLAIGRQVFSEASSIFFGSGPNTFTQQWGLYKPLSVNETQFWNTDFYFGVGFIPTSIVSLGAIGLVAWLIVLFALLAALRRTFTGEAQGIGRLRIALLSGAVYLTVLQILYAPGSAIAILTFVFYAFLVADEYLTKSVREINVAFSWIGARARIFSGALSVLALVVLLSGAQSARVLFSDAFVNRAIIINASRQDLPAASRAISMALLVDSKNDRAHRAAVELGILELARLANSGDQSDAARAQLQQTLSDTIRHGLAAITIEDRNYQNWLSLAYLYRELAGVGVEGAAQNARDAYGKALEDNPTNPLPYLGLAQLDLLAGSDAAGKENLAKALELKPDLAIAHYLLSQIEARAGNLQAAADAAAKAVQILPEDPLGWYNVATVLYAQANYPAAAAALERAVGLQNDYANALFLLGLTYYRLGRTDDALTVLRAVVALNPENADVRGIVAAIEAGEDPFAKGR
ncbi:MAG: tetratricopeptide repeat protein [Candidatus Kaiserbacteria bacterium]|nr:MAG: tetratricopeptide repeat protein [Candidatus Kaiserbacteria bacterium]